MKIAVMGYSGSGKSTIARRLAEIYKIPVLYLDTVQFLPGWVERDKDEARAIAGEFLENESWVIDGNYTKFCQEERLKQADIIIYMDFPRLVCLLSILKRYYQNRNKTRESMAEGCEERLNLEFIWWIIHKGRTKEVRDHYREVITFYKDKTVMLRNRKQADDYMLRITGGVE